MTKTIEQLQAALNREIEYSTGLNWKIDKMREQLKNYISKEEHDKIVSQMKREQDVRMSEIKISQSEAHNERGAGRKKKATNAMIARVLELHANGLSQGKIAEMVSAERDITICRTTVGEIVRGKYTVAQKE